MGSWILPMIGFADVLAGPLVMVRPLSPFAASGLDSGRFGPTLSTVWKCVSLCCLVLEVFMSAANQLGILLSPPRFAEMCNTSAKRLPDVESIR